MRKEADLGKGVRPDHGAHGDGLSGIEHLHGIVGRKKCIDHDLICNIDALDRMRKVEAVDADHDRHRKLLGEPERLNVQIGGFLVRLREELSPPGIAHGHRVGVIVPHIGRRADRPITSVITMGKPRPEAL